MKYRLERAATVERDFALIFEFLVNAHVAFGENEEGAISQAASTLRRIEANMLALGDAPHQGTLRNELGAGVRSVTKNRSIYYFEVDDDTRRLRVLAVFLGGQDHQRNMLKRLLKK